MQLAPSELVLSPEGRIYHLNLVPGELADTVLTVGDPARVQKVSQHFDDVEFTMQHREIITHTGHLNGKRISVISTGMGTPNIDIVLNELDALVNIDFESREIKPELTSLKIIRLGTAGGMQAHIPIGSLALTDFAIGFDNLLNFYQRDITEKEKILEESLLQLFDRRLPVRPYIVEGSTHLRNALAKECVTGMTITTPGFYGPQDRILRAPVVIEDLLDTLAQWKAESPVINFEMETSAMYGMSRILGHEVCSISAILANRQTGEFESDIPRSVDNMIQKVLGML